MRRKAVVVEPLSRSDLHCWKCRAPAPALPFCERCKSIQDVPEDWNHFDVLGAPLALRLDETALRDRFYELSRQTHPDRFASAEMPASLYSLRWTTAINKAYQTLKDPLRRSHYLLQLHSGDLPEGKTNVPLELAEAYFELQDLITEPGGDARLQAFRTDLLRRQAETAGEWKSIAEEWEKAGAEPKTVLQKLRQHLTKQKYLQSMVADVDRKAGA